MHSNTELLGMIEERMIGWSWDCRLQLLAYALSRVDNLPREMENQKNLLGKLQFKVEYYARLRQALEGVTTAHRMRLEIEGPDHPWTMNGALPFSNEAEGRKDTVIHLTSEIKRLEEEFTRDHVDVDGICRFLRTALK